MINNMNEDYASNPDQGHKINSMSSNLKSTVAEAK